jgi:uncharacterized protein YcbK (DUF882 family)
MKLSKNFDLEEFTKSSTAIRLGIRNIASITIINKLKALVKHVLQPMRDKFGAVTVNSGFRHPKLNKRIGGSKTSQHCKEFLVSIIRN